MVNDAAIGKSIPLALAVRRKIESIVARARKLDPDVLKKEFLEDIAYIGTFSAPLVDDFRKLYVLCRCQGHDRRWFEERIFAEIQRIIQRTDVLTAPLKGSTRSTGPMVSNTYEVEPPPNSEGEHDPVQHFSDVHQDDLCKKFLTPLTVEETKRQNEFEKFLDPPRDITWSMLSQHELGVVAFLARVATQGIHKAEELEAERELTSSKDTRDQVAVKPRTRAENLDSFRQKCGWSIEDLAEQAGFDRKTVKRHLQGKKIRLPNLRKYADTFSKDRNQRITVSDIDPEIDS